jgi:hypothetical protein
LALSGFVAKSSIAAQPASETEAAIAISRLIFLDIIGWSLLRKSMIAPPEAHGSGRNPA